MRLTLRTLLAYLDDILEPEQTKEIGKKASESSFASSLINRIREVMRRRRLTAPELTGPGSGLDPNAVSEYLDNTLTPEKVADVEKVCLESDMHLAEVAASHQILTLVLGEPVDISSATRERMYALGPVVTPSQPAGLQPGVAPQAVAVPAVGSAGQSAASAGATSDEGFDRTIPDYLRPKRTFRRTLPYVIVTVAALVWIALVAIDPTIYPRLFGTGDDQKLVVDDEDKNEANLNVDSQFPKDDSKTQVENNGEIVAANSTTNTTDAVIDPGPAIPKNINIDPPPPNDVPDTDVTDELTTKKAPLLPSETTKGNDPQPPNVASKGDTTKVKADTKVEPPIDNKKGKQPAKVVAADAPPIEYAAGNGILLRYAQGKNDWMVVEVQSAIVANDLIASPEPYKASLKVGQDIFQASLMPGTNLQVLSASEKSVVGFRLVEGRLVLSTTDAGANANESIVIGLNLHGESCTLELSGDDALCGIEIMRREPEQLDHDFGEDRYTGALYVINGSVRFVDGEGNAQVIGSKDWLTLTPEDRKKAADPKNAIPRPPLLEIPEWLDTMKKRTSATQRRYASMFTKEFDVTQPLLFSMPAVINAPRPAIAELAVKCLAITDSYTALVQALERADHEEARIAAIKGLRKWLPTDPKNKELLKAELAKHFHPDTAQALYVLTWGYSAKDLTLTTPAPTPSDDLIRWLQHEDIEVREMAFYHVYRLTGKKYDYRPNSSPGQRQAAVRRWLGQLERDQALLTE